MNFLQKAVGKVLNYGIRGMPRMSGTSISLTDINDFFGGVSADVRTNGTDLSEITYFTCLKVLAETLAKLSVHLEDAENVQLTGHPVYNVIKIRPNPYMTPYHFRMLLEYWRNHYGNAYAYIKHDDRTGQLVGLYPLDPRYVQIIIDDTAEFFERGYCYRFSDPRSGKTYLFSPGELIHLKGGLSKDGLCGMCVRETLARSMQGNKAAQNFLNKLYANGLTANAVIKYVGELTQESRKKLLNELKTLMAGDTTNRFIPIPLGMDITPLDLKLTDSQFYELKKFSGLQIAAAFGIKPNQLNNYDKSSYANSEIQQLAFYTDTLLAILTGWEEELNYKLLKPVELAQGIGFKFNVATILRGDIKTQMEALAGYVGAGIYQINEARLKAGLPPLPDGNVNLINGTFVKLEDIGKAYAGKGGDSNA